MEWLGQKPSYYELRSKWDMKNDVKANIGPQEVKQARKRLFKTIVIREDARLYEHSSSKIKAEGFQVLK